MIKVTFNKNLPQTLERYKVYKEKIWRRKCRNITIIFSNLRFTQSFKSSKIMSLLKFAKTVTVIHEDKLRKIDRFVF